MGFQLKHSFCSKILQQNHLNLAMWCAKWRIKLNPEKTKVIIFSRSNLARKTEPNLKLYGETLKVCPQVKFLGITFDSQLNFKKHFEDIQDRCNARYHWSRLLANKKWGPSPSTLIQIYKQCVRPIFEHGSLLTITTADYIIGKIQWLQNKFIRLALCLPKYICPKLLYDSSGLPYVKDRLLSCGSKSLDGHKELTPLFRYHSLGQICTAHLLIILTKPACFHNSFWGGRYDNNHATTISLEPRTLSRRFRHFFLVFDSCLLKAHIITN